MFWSGEEGRTGYSGELDLRGRGGGNGGKGLNFGPRIWREGLAQASWEAEETHL